MLEELKKRKNELYSEISSKETELYKIKEEINKLELKDMPIYNYKGKIVKIEDSYRIYYIKIVDMIKLYNHKVRLYGPTVYINDKFVSISNYDNIDVRIDSELEIVDNYLEKFNSIFTETIHNLF